VELERGGVGRRSSDGGGSADCFPSAPSTAQSVADPPDPWPDRPDGGAVRLHLHRVGKERRAVRMAVSRRSARWPCSFAGLSSATAQDDIYLPARWRPAPLPPLYLLAPLHLRWSFSLRHGDEAAAVGGVRSLGCSATWRDSAGTLRRWIWGIRHANGMCRSL
jgi:hypothetical protein